MKKNSGKSLVRAAKGFNFFISSEDVDAVIKIVESLEKQAY